ncbi:hypothetical protein D3C76_1239100 [compost metagenome]
MQNLDARFLQRWQNILRASTRCLDTEHFFFSKNPYLLPQALSRVGLAGKVEVHSEPFSRGEAATPAKLFAKLIQIGEAGGNHKSHPACVDHRRDVARV